MVWHGRGTFMGTLTLLNGCQWILTLVPVCIRDKAEWIRTPDNSITFTVTSS